MGLPLSGGIHGSERQDLLQAQCSKHRNFSEAGQDRAAGISFQLRFSERQQQKAPGPLMYKIWLRERRHGVGRRDGFTSSQKASKFNSLIAVSKELYY